MATLTADELADIRLVVGDGCDKFSDIQIQAWYDAADSDLLITYVTILERLWAATKAGTITLSNGSQAVTTAQAQLIKERLDYWRARAGLAPGAAIQLGVLTVDIDTTSADV